MCDEAVSCRWRLIPLCVRYQLKQVLPEVKKRSVQTLPSYKDLLLGDNSCLLCIFPCMFYFCGSIRTGNSHWGGATVISRRGCCLSGMGHRLGNMALWLRRKNHSRPSFQERVRHRSSKVLLCWRSSFHWSVLRADKTPCHNFSLLQFGSMNTLLGNFF